MESSWKNIIYGNLRPKNFEKKTKPKPSFFEYSFCIYFLDLFFVYFLIIYFVNHILRRWGIENDSFSINKIHKSLDMNFVFVKNHEQGFTLNLVFSWNVP